MQGKRKIYSTKKEVSEMKKLFLVPLAILLLVALIFGGCAKPAPAPAPAPVPAPAPAPAPVKPIVMKFALSGSPMALTNTMAVEPWARELEKRTNGRVQVKTYYGEALGRSSEYYDMLMADAVELAGFTMHILPGHFPLSDLYEIPLLIPYGLRDKTGKRIDDIIIQKWVIPLSFPKELKPLCFTRTTPSCIHSVEKPVRKLEDMKGLLLGFPGGKVVPSMLRAWGASGEVVLPPDMYTCLDKKMVDAQWIPAEANLKFKLYEVTKYMILTRIGGGITTNFMSPKTWANLPPDIQKIVDELSPLFWDWSFESFVKGDEEAIENAKKAGLEIIELSPEEVARWVKTAEGVADKWVAEMEAEGIPAKEIVADIQRLVAEALKK